jgi:hypothetical protein
MTASEFAFLALGLVLGVASGAALVVVLGSRPPAREVKVTVGHDAVPRRAATLSSDAFTAHGEPARGGPADRRRLDRDAPPEDPPPPFRGTAGLAGVAVMQPAPALAMPPARPAGGLGVRTIVPSALPPGAATPGRPWPGLPAASSSAGNLIAADRDPSLDALRIQAVLSAERAQRAGLPTATALLETRPGSLPDGGHPVRSGSESADEAIAADATPAIIRILRGDQRALLETVAVLAGADAAMRRPWQAAINALADGVIHRAIAHGVLDFPVGNPFWDSFTTEQCRTISAALAASGYRFDGIDGWADGRVPSYRDLAAAVAAAGLEPRRIRAWPTTDEIAALCREVTVAADDFIAAQAPELELEQVRALIPAGSPDLDFLWRHWELGRSALAAPSLAGPGRPGASSGTSG